MSPSRTPARSAPALLLLAVLATPATGHAADDPTCVGPREYKAITSGMSIAQLQKAVHGQVPFAETDGHGKQHYRWYAACDAWRPDDDVAVRYLKPVVGRRTVTKKQLAVYPAPIS
jgi:hypothetical protein